MNILFFLFPEIFLTNIKKIQLKLHFHLMQHTKFQLMLNQKKIISQNWFFSFSCGMNQRKDVQIRA